MGSKPKKKKKFGTSVSDWGLPFHLFGFLSHTPTLPNCLSSWMREPLPKELVRLAWKASVGYSWESTATQRFCSRGSGKTKKKQKTEPGGNSTPDAVKHEFQPCEDRKLFICHTVTQVGMRSHLLSTNIRCFQGFSFFRYVSMLPERVPMGSRASRTWMMTSEESITCWQEVIRRAHSSNYFMS